VTGASAYPSPKNLAALRFFDPPSRGGWKVGRMLSRVTKAVLITAVLAATSGCSVYLRATADAPERPAPPTASAPADPFVSVRPATASVGVTMPEREDFQHPWDISTYILRVTQFGTLAPLNGGIAFVGDSLVDWARWNEMFPGQRVRNFGIAGDTTVGLQHRLSQVIDAKPAKAFLMIGTNDVEFSRYTPAEIVAHIVDIAAKLKAAGITVYVESLLPREARWDDKVRTVNTLLQTAMAAQGTTYIDLYPRFVKNGRLDPAITPDDIHLSGAGYARWCDAIRPFIGTN
jgi:hypothetical protein